MKEVVFHFHIKIGVMEDWPGRGELLPGSLNKTQRSNL